MTVTYDNRVAIVTGAGGGLGREHAILLARQGVSVVVNDIGAHPETQAPMADRVVDEIRAFGGKAVANYDSVDTAVAAQRIIATAIDAFGRLDILVNNAGILRDRSFAKVELADFELVLRVHLMGAIYCTHAAWPHLIEQKHGRVILTTSVAGLNGNFGQSAYGAAKMGMIGLMNCLALEGRKSNVLINAVSPGAQTRMTEAVNPAHLVPYLDPALISPMVAWLASDECNVSGEIFWAAAGGFARYHYFETEGVQFDPLASVTPQMVAESIDTIRDLKRPIPSVPGSFGRFEERLRAVGRWDAPE
nr:SDR family NAD(P)-dependent oxidoreductase [uncultured Brevundimonas sp.]